MNALINSMGVSKGLKGYWEDTRRPVYSAVLVLPFLLVYELGIIFYKPKYINGGDAIIRKILGLVSGHVAFASAMVCLACFVIWQIRTKASWKINPRAVFYLYIESLLFAFLLFLFLSWLTVYLPKANAVIMAHGSSRGPILKLVLYCGAGVYEELVFRVLLLGLLMLVFTKLAHWEKMPAAITSVLLGAVIFSLFHYVGGAEQFHINSFMQRTFAGIYFAAIYVTRSFGVAASAHALYDILVEMY